MEQKAKRSITLMALTMELLPEEKKQCLIGLH